MFKRKIYINLLLIALAFTCTSCIGIIEKVFFKKNGSGTYSMTLDMSKMADMMDMLSDDDQQNEMDVALTDMNKVFDDARKKLKGLEGISNLTQNMNAEKFIYNFSFDFTDIDALNAGLNRFLKDTRNPQPSTYFKAGKKSFSRTNTDHLSEVMNNQLGISEAPDFDPSILLSDAYHETIIEFERKVKSVSNDGYKKNGNTISLKRLFFDKNNSSKKTDVTVKLK